MRDDEKGFSGWKNWETWNVALWIGNDEGLYHIAKEFQRQAEPYLQFRQYMNHLETGLDNAAIRFQTPDGVAWNDSALDIHALDEMIKEL